MVAKNLQNELSLTSFPVLALIGVFCHQSVEEIQRELCVSSALELEESESWNLV